MKRMIQLNVEDYVYQFYKKGADALNRTAEELMEQAILMYAGMIAEDLLQSDEETLKS